MALKQLAYGREHLHSTIAPTKFLKSVIFIPLRQRKLPSDGSFPKYLKGQG